MQRVTDRRFLLTAGGAAMLAAGPLSVTWAAGGGADPIADWTVVNALGELADPNFPDQVDGTITPRLLTDAHASGEAAVNITLGYVAGKDDPFESSVASIGRWDRAIREHPRDLMKIDTAADILRAKAEKKIGLIYGFQNAAMTGQDAGRVDLFADLGMKVMQLTYNPMNQLGGGSMAPEDTPLTEFGHKVIDRLNARRLMVDLSHSGRRTCLEAARYSRQPISINHTGCRALMDLPRNKTDEELRLVAERGGFIGIYFMPFLDPKGHATAAEVVAHIDHAVTVCGEDHVGIGTDGGATPIDDLQAYVEMLRKEHADRVAKGVAAPGEGADTHPFVDDLRGPGQFRKLAGLLKARGFSSSRIEKVLGANFVRYARDVWGA